MDRVSIDITSVFLLLGSAQAFYLAYFFLLKGRTDRCNLYSGLLLVVMGLQILDVLLEQTRLIERVIFLYNFSQPTALLLGPLFFLWLTYALKRKLLYERLIRLHFLPFVLYTLYYGFFYFQPNDFKQTALERNQNPDAAREIITIRFDPDPLNVNEHFEWLLAAVLIFYLVLSVIMLLRSRGASSQVSVRKGFIAVLLGIGVGLLAYFLSRVLFTRDLGDFLPAVYLSLLVYFVSGSVLRDSRFLNRNWLTDGKTYQKAVLPQERIQRIEKRILHAFEEEKLYQNPDFNLEALAVFVKASRHNTSQILNAHMGMSFSEISSQYRVEEACRILKNREYYDWSIERIAETVGYNSRSAFIKTFQKIKGVSPSVYRQKTKR
ncbi:MAG: helix-turn-helix transcriptional regulator [Roseivirga sp.]|nr:helix-turn-helix transcriptional regulator [Roseivirga sp.]